MLVGFGSDVRVKGSVTNPVHQLYFSPEPAMKLNVHVTQKDSGLKFSDTF